MLNLPGVFALLTRYAPAPRVASPPPAPAGEKCAHPAGEKRSKDYIRTCPGPKSEAPTTRFLSLSICPAHVRNWIRAVDCSLARNLLCRECP